MREAHRQLEQCITERTADLSATNVSLEEKIEALKVTETILRETRDGAVQAGKLAVLGQMAAGISHEINQPLTAMQTFTDNAVDLLERGQLDGVRENLGIISQTLCLKAWELGLGSVIIGSFDHKAAEELLGVPEGVELVALIALGYPDQDPPAPKRREVGEFVHFGRFPAR